MNKPIFNTKTQRGVMLSTSTRRCLEGEFVADLTPQQFALFSANPRRYGFVNGVFTDCSAEVAAEAAAKEKIQQRAEIAGQRYDKEVANMVHDGHEWCMDRECRTTLYLTIAEVLSGETPQEYFKTATGWYLITPENAKAIKTAGRAHVKAAFAWEKSQVDQLG